MNDDAYHRAAPKLAVIVPCYNEQEVLPSTVAELAANLDALACKDLCAPNSFIVLIDDGSRDRTWDIIVNAARADNKRIIGIKLAVNAGHQYALLAGLDHATGRSDASISIDADLQDDPNAMEAMLAAYRRGTELVLGVRSSRASDTAFKRSTADLFYAGMHILGVDVIQQHADYRLMSAMVMRNLQTFPEYHLFLRGLQRRLSRRSEIVYYERRPRLLGKSKYTLGKMLSLAWDGITSFSIAPLRLIAAIGAAIFVVASGLAVYAFSIALAGETVPGWASITVPLYVLGGVTILSLGVVGEYVGKTYIEVKRRPRYIVEEVEG